MHQQHCKLLLMCNIDAKYNIIADPDFVELRDIIEIQLPKVLCENQIFQVSSIVIHNPTRFLIGKTNFKIKL